MNSSLLGASAAIALLAVGPATAAGPTISYVWSAPLELDRIRRQF
jgi:hypothetical protein